MEPDGIQVTPANVTDPGLDSLLDAAMNDIASHLPQAVAPPSTPQLPMECIEIILKYLWDDLPTMHTLLLCSRTLFFFTVPILYRDPFRLIAEHRIWKEESKSQRTAHLMRLLYSSAKTKPGQDKSLSNCESTDPVNVDISLALFPHSTSASTPTTSTTSTTNMVTTRPIRAAAANIASKLPSIPSPPNLLLTNSNLPALQLPLTTDYLCHYIHQGQIPKAFKAFQLLNPGGPSVPRRHSPRDRAAFENAVAYASTEWALTMYGHYPSKIQVLTMTPAQLGIILKKKRGLTKWQGIGSLLSLRRLELEFGARTTFRPRWLATNSHEDGSDDNETDYPLQFIQEHQRLFPTTAEKSSTPLWTPANDDNHSEEGATSKGEEDGTLLQEVAIRGSHSTWSPIQLLARIKPLKVVDLSAWNMGVPHIEQIPCSRLQSLKVNIARRLDSVQVGLPFLGHCSSLQEIWMPSQAPDTFLWAVDASKPIGEFESPSRLRRRIRGDTTNVASVAGTEGEQLDQQPQDPFDPTQIPVMKKVQLYGGPLDLAPSLEDAADAFRDSLEELCGYEDGYGRRDEYPRMCISWAVPHLSYLDLRGRFVYFFDLSSLRQCPDLRVVKLQIETNMSSTEGTGDNPKSHTAQLSRGTRWDFSVFAKLRRLEELQLRGTSWGLNDDTLEVLAGTPSFATGMANEKSFLPESLRYFLISESHLPSKRGLIRFVQAMEKLTEIQLGTMNPLVKESLQAAGGRRLFVATDV
ncbi:hypothetical protein BG011_009716 [Mortierella polycephala]|uniref:Uncharacterized protein n=1 Tax=Mortierella polycephala TaxID=41804 RepID=A0A9P6PN97_9FUNG|nr:hypothetical protein BG011_009716 [Mortierella polycephala]